MRYKEFGLIRVGQTHPRSLDTEGAEFLWCADSLELMLTFKEPSLLERWAVTSGIFEVTLNVIEQIPFLCFRIFQVNDSEQFNHPKSATLVLPWQECPFHLVQVEPDRLPAFEYVMQNPESGLPITVVLTDLETATVKAVRQLKLNPFFSRSLVDALLSSFPYYTTHSYPEAVDRVFAQFPTNTIGDTTRIRCRSGD
jgi:hypothetical protein